MIKNLVLLSITISCLIADDVKLVNFSLKDLDKKKYNTQDLYKEGPILMNFWNLACEPCKKEMKFLNEFEQKYEEYGFNVISVNMDTPRSLSKVKSYIKSKKYSFTVLSDPRSQLFRKTGGSIMPYTLMVDTSGIIQNKHTGYNLGDEIKIEQEILTILGLDSLKINEEEQSK
tara:strand:- start:18 stop:536 length:519 start_codon:yes stop_codon:yes gene_type:complete